ncbi:MAG: SGNH/GDSL hydrolase family protein [Pirellulales bacterium]|nr:SGNH/GDSL hydrolase family protein [Pirellulales bacterium]
MSLPTLSAGGSSAPRFVRASRWRRLVVVLLTFGVATLLAFGVVELFFRMFVPVMDVPYYFWDPVVGPRRVPFSEGRFINGTSVNTHFRFNQQGWNHPRNYSLPRYSGVKRVCILGDSFVEALHVEQQQSLFAVAEKIMSRHDRPVEWYAFGISGWGTAQQYEVLRHYALDYQPDVVVLLFVENDPLDSSPYLLPIEPQLCTYALDSDAKLVLMPAGYWQRPLWKRLLIESTVARYFVLQKNLLSRGQRDFQSVQGLQLREAAYSNALPRLPEAAEMPLEKRQQLTWLLIEKLLEAFRDRCREHQAQFVLAFRGNVWQIESALGDAKFEPLSEDTDPYCLAQSHGRMGEKFLQPICERLAIPYLDLTTPLRAWVKEHGQSHIFPDDNHYSEAGHAAAGEAIAAWIEQLWQQQAAEASSAGTTP